MVEDDSWNYALRIFLEEARGFLKLHEKEGMVVYKPYLYIDLDRRKRASSIHKFCSFLMLR